MKYARGTFSNIMNIIPNNYQSAFYIIQFLDYKSYNEEITENHYYKMKVNKNQLNEKS